MNNLVNVSSLYKREKPILSFEFFPPKTAEGIDKTKAVISESSKFNPDFVTVTYRAASASRALTKELVQYSQDKVGLPAVAHLTTYGLDQEQLHAQLKEWDNVGITNVLALRGDPPLEDEHARVQSFENALELTKFIKSNFPHFCILTAAYPEGHKESRSIQGEVDYLKEKIDAGASAIITQLFFDVDALKFRDLAAKAGIHAPLIPGILPVSGIEQLKRFQEMCNVLIPTKPQDQLSSVSANDEKELKEKMRHLGFRYAAGMIQLLIEEGIPGIHVYSLNNMFGMEEIVNAVR